MAVRQALYSYIINDHDCFLQVIDYYKYNTQDK
jgi:hypothetical protein